jgi:hypothetical protein
MPSQKSVKSRPIAKNWKFYRRQGAIWTDLYHTPQERRRLAGFRPDLEKKRKERIAHSKQLEKQRERCSRLFKSKQIEKIKQSFNRQRKLNAAKEFSSRKLIKECETEIEASLRSKNVVVKDEYWWQSQKAHNKPMMSMTRIHPERLHWVLSDKILIADFQAALNILKKLESERKAELDDNAHKQQRVAEIRNHFRERLMGRNMKHCSARPRSRAHPIFSTKRGHTIWDRSTADMSTNTVAQSTRTNNEVITGVKTMSTTKRGGTRRSATDRDSSRHRSRRKAKGVTSVASGMTEFRGLSTLDTGLLRKIERFVASGNTVPYVDSKLFLQMKALGEGEDTATLEDQNDEDILLMNDESSYDAVGHDATDTKCHDSFEDEISKFERTHGLEETSTSRTKTKQIQMFPGRNFKNAFPGVSCTGRELLTKMSKKKNKIVKRSSSSSSSSMRPKIKLKSRKSSRSSKSSRSHKHISVRQEVKRLSTK